MKGYNVQNYVRYKMELEKALKNLEPVSDYTEIPREEIKTRFLPLVENIARKFSTSQQACGVMSIMDLIQEGSYGLCKAVSKLDREN